MEKKRTRGMYRMVPSRWYLPWSPNTTRKQTLFSSPLYSATNRRLVQNPAFLSSSYPTILHMLLTLSPSTIFRDIFSILLPPCRPRSNPPLQAPSTCPMPPTHPLFPLPSGHIPRHYLLFPYSVFCFRVFSLANASSFLS